MVRSCLNEIVSARAVGEGESAAGGLGDWLDGIRAAIRGERDADVPCGTCSACCTGSQFVHIGPDEVDALAQIPAELLFPAPLMPEGHVVLGYDERGHCPMLVEGRCSIYAHRPRTCRTYDCRAFAVAGVEPEDPRIAQRVHGWRFDPLSADETARLEAVRAAVDALAERPDLTEAALRVPSTSGLVALAVSIHDAFLSTGADGSLLPADPTPEEVQAAVARESRRS